MKKWVNSSLYQLSKDILFKKVGKNYMFISDDTIEVVYLKISEVIVRCAVPHNMVKEICLDYKFFFIPDTRKYDLYVCAAKDIEVNNDIKSNSFVTKLGNRCFLSDNTLFFWGNHIMDVDFYLKEFRKYLIAVISWILHKDKDMILLHASAVEMNGRCVLFAGNSGSGKTTMAMNLVKKGAKYISNDLTFMYVRGDKVMVLGVPQKITMEKDTYEHCGLNYAVEKDINRMYIDPAGQIAVKLNAELDTIVLLSKDVRRAEPLLEQVDVHAGMARLISKTIHAYKWGFKPFREDYGYFSVLNRILKCIEKNVSLYCMIWGKNHCENYNIIMKEVIGDEGRIK